MIPEDDKLYKWLSAVSSGQYECCLKEYDFVWMIAQLDFVELEPDSLACKLTDRGRAWMDAVRNDRRFRVLEGRHLALIHDTETKDALGIYVGPDKHDTTWLTDAADAAIKAGWE